MARLRVKGIAFDMYGTVVDVGAVAVACKGIAPDPTAFAALWRTKQLEYTFLLSLMGKYRNFWTVSDQALEFTTRRLGVEVSPEQRPRLMNAWLEPRPYPEVPAVLARLKERYPLAILSNGSPKMLRAGLAHSGLKADFRWVISADAVKLYKPAPKVYAQAPKQMNLKKASVLGCAGSTGPGSRWMPWAPGRTSSWRALRRCEPRWSEPAREPRRITR